MKEHLGLAFGEFKGDARRMRIYKWMLQEGTQMIQADDEEAIFHKIHAMSFRMRIE